MHLKEKLHHFWFRFKVTLSHWFWLRWSLISLREIQKVARIIPEFEVKAHLYITWKTWSGKSSLTLIWIYWQWWKSRKKNDRNLIVIDPHWSMVELLRKTKLAKKYSDQLIYIDPALSKNHTPTINPLECRDKNPADIEIKANQLVIAIQELIPDAKLSNYMKAILKPCLFVLLSKKTATLEDLQEFLWEDNQFRLEQGKKSKVKAYRDFFRNEFMNPIYLRTKQSIYTKIQSLLNSQIFYDFTIWVSTLDLAREVRQGKVILFNLSKGKLSEEVAGTIGRFIIAQLKSIALKRASLPPHLWKPIYLVIDEVDAFCRWDTLNIILKETRKMGLHLRVISQNIVSWKWYEKLKRNLINNTNVKIIWANGLATLKALSNGKRTTKHILPRQSSCSTLVQK